MKHPGLVVAGVATALLGGAVVVYFVSKNKTATTATATPASTAVTPAPPSPPTGQTGG